MEDVASPLTLASALWQTPSVRSAREASGIMVEGYLNAPSVIVSCAKTISSSIKHLAKCWRQKVLNVIIAIRSAFILRKILYLQLDFNSVQNSQVNRVIVWGNTLVSGARHAIARITFVEKVLNMKRINLFLVQNAATRRRRLRI